MQAPAGSVGRQGLPGAASPQAMIKLSRPPRGRDGLRAYRVVVDDDRWPSYVGAGPAPSRSAPAATACTCGWTGGCAAPEVEVNLASGASGVFLCRPRGGVLDSLELVDSNPGAYLELIRIQ